MTSTTANPRPTAIMRNGVLFQLYRQPDGTYRYPNWWPDADEKRENDNV